VPWRGRGWLINLERVKNVSLFSFYRVTMSTSQLGLRKLGFRDALAHRCSRRDTASNSLHQVVDIVRAAPLCSRSSSSAPHGHFFTLRDLKKRCEPSGG